MATAEKKRPRISSGAGRRTSRKEVHLFSLPQILFSLVGMQSLSSFFPAYSIVCSYPLMHSCACYGHGQSTSENLVYVPKLYLLPYTKVQGALPDFIRVLDFTPNVR